MKTYGHAVKEIIEIVGKYRGKYMNNRTMTEEKRDRLVIEDIEAWLKTNYEAYIDVVTKGE